MIAVVALLLSGCASTGDITARVAPTAQPGSSTDSDGPGGAMAAPNSSGPSNVAVSPRQRGYLDALAAAGVRPSTDLMALSIGSYVCQGRAAGQSDQAVWDFVFPLVRNDVVDAQDGAGADSAAPGDVGPRQHRPVHSHRHRTTLLEERWPVLRARTVAATAFSA